MSLSADNNESSRNGIVLQNVSKRYDTTCALDNINFEFQPNKTTAIVGTSGCGKSTLLKCINGLITPDSGTLNVFGEALSQTNLLNFRRRLGYCVQHIGLFPHLSLSDNITLLARLSDWQADAIEQRLQLLTTTCELDQSLLQRFPHEVSGGQQQRAGLCRALMLKPDGLLLDEAFAAVDPITRIDIYRQFQQLQQLEKRTTLIVTHDVREALTLADVILVMRDGAIIHSQETAFYLGQPNPEQAVLEHIRHAVS